MSPLRVLSIAHTAVSRAAGRLRYHEFAGDPGLDVHLVVPTRWYQFGRWLQAEPGNDPDSDPGVTVAALPIRLPRAGPASWYLHHYPGLGRLTRRFAPAVIHLWEEPWSLVALQASVLARRCGAALVLEVDQNILKPLPPPFEQIRRHVLRRSDLILSRSDAATAVVQACGYTGAIAPIGYGVDQRVFRPGAATEPSPGLHLGYVGRLVAEKGLDDVLGAMGAARGNIRLSILGEGPHEAALRSHVAAAGLDDRVSFRPWTDPAGVAAFLRHADALVLPTRTTGAVKEQFGRVIIEAQACGTPVIGAASGAIPSVLGRGGWVVPERDPAALAALLERLAADPAERAARAQDGLANVAARFTYAAVANDLRRGWHRAVAYRASTQAATHRPSTNTVIAGARRA